MAWWVPASHRFSAVASLAQLADRLGVGDDDEETAALAVVRLLSQRGRWLLVYDDASDLADLTALIPGGPGHLLITSRNPRWEHVARPLPVLPFDQDHSVRLLIERTADPDRRAAAKLADRLQGLPLALEQAASFCQQTGISLSSYVETYDAHRARLLRRGVPPDYPTSVAVTLERSLRLVARRNPAAGQLLRLLAYLAPSAIPRGIAAFEHQSRPRRLSRLREWVDDLVHGEVHAPWSEPGRLPRALARAAGDPIRHEEAVGSLLSLSLVTPDQPGSLRIHQLVQHVLQDHIADKTQPSPANHPSPHRHALAWRQSRRWVGRVALDPGGCSTTQP